MGNAGHAAEADEDRDSTGAAHLAAEDADSAASSDEEGEHPATALPRPLPETDAEAGAAAQEAGTSGNMGRDGSPLALSPNLITLALLPRSQWQGLLYLDAIKVCYPYRPPMGASAKVHTAYAAHSSLCCMPLGWLLLTDNLNTSIQQHLPERLYWTSHRLARTWLQCVSPLI